MKSDILEFFENFEKIHGLSKYDEKNGYSA